MKTSAAIREYLIEIEVRKYTPKTIRGYRNSLNLFLRFCEQEAHIQEVEEINLAAVRQFSAFMSQKRSRLSSIAMMRDTDVGCPVRTCSVLPKKPF